MAKRKKSAQKKSGKKRVIFSLDVQDATDVKIAGDFNGWDTDKNVLKKNQKGVWTKMLYLVPGNYEYKFVVDGEWTLDPACEETASNPHGGPNNVLQV